MTCINGIFTNEANREIIYIPENGLENRVHYSSYEDGFRDIYPRIVRTLMVAYGDREVAADIAQEAMAKAYAQWKKVNSYEIPGAWVRKVAINGLRDHIRKESRRSNGVRDPILQLSTIESIEASMPTPLAVDFARALEKLPSQQRIAATLAYVDDCSIAEIAKAMKISEGTVKSHLHYARETLQEFLSGALA